MQQDDDTDDNPEVFDTPEEALQYLRHAGLQDDADIDPGAAALALALLFLPGLNPDRYRQHLKKLKAQLAEDVDFRLRQGDEDTLSFRAARLRHLLHEVHGYDGDHENYDDIQNASLIRVIERRKGLPIALGIIYILLARSMGWTAEGLSFPGHFLLRLEQDGQRLILDPFRKGREMEAGDLRQLLKSIAGEKAELSHRFYESVGNRELLLRLQNNLKKRLIENEDYATAIVVLESMEALAPDEYRTLFDKGVLYAKLHQYPQAEEALGRYIDRVPDAREKQQAHDLLLQIRSLH